MGKAAFERLKLFFEKIDFFFKCGYISYVTVSIIRVLTTSVGCEPLGGK
jgi:hypothetical protein